MPILEDLQVLTDTIRDGWIVRPRKFDFKPEGALKIAANFDRRVAEIDSNENFNRTGKANSRINAVKESLAAATQWESRVVDVLTHRVESETAAIARANAKPEPTDPTEKLLREIKFQEIRRNLGDLDPVLAELFYYENPEIRPALEGAPPRLLKTPEGLRLVPLISQEVRERTALAEAKDARPEATAQIAELGELRDSYASIAGALKTALRKQVRDLPGALDVEPVAAAS